jgi:hypothetical protein
VVHFYRLARVEGAWGQGGLDDEHVPGLHLPGVDAGCGVVGESQRSAEGL